MTSAGMTPGTEWQTPRIEQITDPDAMSDQAAPIRNGGLTSIG
jgi:hypothetical protein